MQRFKPLVVPILPRPVVAKKKPDEKTEAPQTVPVKGFEPLKLDFLQHGSFFAGLMPWDEKGIRQQELTPDAVLASPRANKY